MKPWIKKHLAPLSPCKKAVEWAEDYDSLETAWQACDRGDWLLWYAACCTASEAEHKRLVLAACACARLALPLCQPGETRPLRAVETAEAWARGDDGFTLRDVNAAYAAANAAAANAAAFTAAAYAAAAAANAAAAAAAANAAYAAAAAAAAANAAANAAYAAAAANAAYAAAYAAAAAVAAANAAYAATRKRCAEIVREYYPTPPARKEGEIDGDGTEIQVGTRP